MQPEPEHAWATLSAVISPKGNAQKTWLLQTVTRHAA
tara:strand:- start:199 stop:309 length:111 start_codon:yes stop_codon:yes gene_type:complete